MLYMNKTSAAIDTSELKDIKIEYSKGKKKKIILIVHYKEKLNTKEQYQMTK